MARVRPDVVFNATAWNRVDAAETEPAAAFAVNAAAPHFLARAARDAGALLVHFSTDYVFDGTAARPTGRTTRRVRSVPTAHRSSPASTSWPPPVASTSSCARAASSGAAAASRRAARSWSGSSRRRGPGEPLRVVADQFFAPTCAADLAQASIALVRAGARGLFHVTNAGSCSWHELACAALAAAASTPPVEPIAVAELAACRRAARLLGARRAALPRARACPLCATGATRCPTASAARGRFDAPRPFRSLRVCPPGRLAQR